MELVSVIVPAFNQGSYIAEALESIKNQTYKNWECIIVNDGSTDNTEDVALKYCRLDSRFRYIFIENSGVSAARNKGVSLSSGAYILPLDADDKVAPIYLEKAIDIFSKNDSVSLIYGEAEMFGAVKGKWHLSDYSYFKLLIKNIIYCSAIFKRVDFDRIQGFSEKLIYGYEDWDLWLRLLNREALVIKLPDTVFYYRIKSVSRTTELRLDDRKTITEKLIFERNRDSYIQHLHELIKDYRVHLAKHQELNRFQESYVYKVYRSIKNLKFFLVK
ncbi:glycosyltransferase [Pontibacter virosus]|uniref:Glycosyltransferase involved in cell wall biosynthesis n=1 Tax=Pontibacter virosus TaxID=1765052 RepID=A0A2U1B349_9BACT|nr:glycosyltransferase [Pontibacter virosus]PVY43031.1 glycosyltransferase involved in cell wall biosynthesis [Pontibacter virosus]